MSEQMTVLVIDDERVTRHMVKHQLDRHGFKVYTAKNGRAGLSLARTKSPNLILLDWMMPRMDGMEVLFKLKHNIETEHIPVFMLTAKEMIDEIQTAFEIGADDYITKPIDTKSLGKIIRQKLEEHLVAKPH